jgi:hypothetical protein
MKAKSVDQRIKTAVKVFGLQEHVPQDQIRFQWFAAGYKQGFRAAKRSQANRGTVK